MTRDHAAWIHQGTTVDRNALGLSTEGLSTEWWDTDLSQFHKWNGTAWVVFGPGADHGLLGGLGDDDHPQYTLNLPLASARNVISAATATIRPLAIQTTDDDTTEGLLEILDSGGNPGTVITPNADVLVKPFANTATTFDVQTAAGARVLTVHTTNNKVIVGADITQGAADPAMLVVGGSHAGATPGARILLSPSTLRQYYLETSALGSFVIGETLVGDLLELSISGKSMNFVNPLFLQRLNFPASGALVLIGDLTPQPYFLIGGPTHDIAQFNTAGTFRITKGATTPGTGTINFYIDLNGNIAIGGGVTNPLATLRVTPNTAATIGFMVKGAAAQADNLVELRDSNDNDLWLIEHDGGQSIQQAVVTTGAPTPSLLVTSAAHTTLTASTERHEVHLDLSATQQWATGALGTQRAIRIEPPTYSAVGASVLSNASTVYIDGPPVAGANMTLTNASALIIASGATVMGEATKQTNAGALQLSGYLTFKEDAGAPTADAGYVKVWSESDNHLYYQSGDGDNHLLHGPAFSSIWYHGPASTLAIAATLALTKITTFVNVGEEDDEGHAVGDVGNDEILLANGGGGSYEVGFGASLTATGAAKELICVAGIELTTPLDITNVTDDLVTPIVITSVAHGLNNGDMVQISGVLVNTAANGSFMVTNKAADTFEIVDLEDGATTGNGDYDEGTPTGDVTIWYPGCITTHVVVSQTTIQALSSPGTPSLSLANGDKIGLYVANLDDANDVNFSVVTLSVNRLDAH